MTLKLLTRRVGALGNEKPFSANPIASPLTSTTETQPTMKNFRPISIALALILVLGNVSLRGDVLIGPIINPANGHSYFLLSSNTWTASQSEAVTQGGNLVTIDNAVENNWVFDTFSGGQRNLWIGLNDIDTNGVYSWVDATVSSYFNWDTGPSVQPDGTDLWVFMARGDLGQGLTARKWHDVANDPASQFAWIGPVFGVVESPFCSPHKAAAAAQLVNGVLVGATITDPGCGYTNAPVVLIQGGGGNGATATAVVSNGVVTNIQITSGGGCYTNAPKIVIGSPPFVPSVSIAVSRVKVTQNVVLGRKYVLESSADLVTWTATGPEFTAESETIVSEFEVAETGSFFRIRQVSSP